LQQGKAKFALRSGNLLSLRRQRRQPAIGGIDNPPNVRAPVRFFGREHVICRRPRTSAQCPALRGVFVATLHGRSLSIELRSLGLGEEFLVRKFGRTLQGRIGFVGPNALQIGFAPRRDQAVGDGGGTVPESRRKPAPTSV